MGRYGTGMRDCCDSLAQQGTPHIKGCPNELGVPRKRFEDTFRAATVLRERFSPVSTNGGE